MTVAGQGTEADTGSGGERSSLRELAALFLKLGVLGFGGPAAHVAMMRDEVVRRRGWVDDAEFLEMVGATNLIPGPNSTELAIHLGHRRAGWSGLLVAGACFILPAVVIVGLLAWLYQRYGTDPAVVDVRYGVLPVIIAIVAQALYGLGRQALVGWLPAMLAVVAMVGFLLDWHELALLVGAGAVSAAWFVARARAARDRPARPGPHTAGGGAGDHGAGEGGSGGGAGRAGRLAPFLVVPWDRVVATTGSGFSLATVTAVPAVAGAVDVSLARLLFVFLEIGSVLYGSGYVLLAFLEARLVDDLGWLTAQQLLDSVTVGQVTPGPVFTTATFVGWQIDGLAGAVVATIGIFAPAFVFVALLGPIVRWMRRWPAAKAFLDGVVAASLGLMAGVWIELLDAAVVDVATGVGAVVALVLLLRTSLNSAWLIGAGALLALARTLL